VWLSRVQGRPYVRDPFAVILVKRVGDYISSSTVVPSRAACSLACQVGRSPDMRDKLTFAVFSHREGSFLIHCGMEAWPAALGVARNPESMYAQAAERLHICKGGRLRGLMLCAQVHVYFPFLIGSVDEGRVWRWQHVSLGHAQCPHKDTSGKPCTCIIGGKVPHSTRCPDV
jgi:hypothetical protein